MQWKPIETAPKDGSLIILGGGEFQRPVFAWWTSRGYWAGDQRGPYEPIPYAPTHWQPAPTSPPHNTEDRAASSPCGAWERHPETIEAKKQWNAVAEALGADKDCPDTVLAVAKAVRVQADRYVRVRRSHWSISPFCVVRDPLKNVKLGSVCPSGEQLDELVDAVSQTLPPVKHYVCKNRNSAGVCPLHNLHCGYPKCEEPGNG